MAGTSYAALNSRQNGARTARPSCPMDAAGPTVQHGQQLAVHALGQVFGFVQARLVVTLVSAASAVMSHFLISARVLRRVSDCSSTVH